MSIIGTKSCQTMRFLRVLQLRHSTHALVPLCLMWQRHSPMTPCMSPSVGDVRGLAGAREADIVG